MRSPRIRTGNLQSNESFRLTCLMEDILIELQETDGIDSFASTGRLPDGFFRLLNDFYVLSDAYVYHNTVDAGNTIICQSGCGRCCHQPVRGMYSFEVVSIHRQVNSRPDTERIRLNFRELASRFTNAVTVSAQRLRCAENDPAAEDAAQEMLMREGYPCPFLIDGSCSIYAGRAIVCRNFFSLTAPVLCTTDKGVTFSIEYPPEITEGLHELSKRVRFTDSDELAQSFCDLDDVLNGRVSERGQTTSL